MKLLLFTILLISSTNLRLKITQTENENCCISDCLKSCCNLPKSNIDSFATFSVKSRHGDFKCAPSESVGETCYCDKNCLSNKCVDYKCAKKIVGESCKSNIECSLSEEVYCLGGKCTQL